MNRQLSSFPYLSESFNVPYKALFHNFFTYVYMKKIILQIQFDYVFQSLIHIQ